MIYDEISMNNGVIFQHAYDILNKKMHQGITNITHGSSGTDGKATLDAALLVTVVVNCAFACELYMKSMLPKDARGHKLDDLFALLDNDIQRRIRSITIDEMKKSDPAYCDTDFQTNLIHHNNIFPEWRYFHEGNCNSINLQFISAFMNAVFSVVNEERKK